MCEGGIGESGRLPTEAKLCRHYGTSHHKVLQAFHDLGAEGLVQRVSGFAAPS